MNHQPYLGTKPLARALGAVLAGLAAVATAQAQDNTASDDAETLESVVVTGSKIKRTDLETSQPVLSISKEDIQATGLTQIGDILQDLTIGGATLNQTFNNGGDGTVRVSLRDLGSNRTLVLVNGRRFAPAGTALSGAVDLSTLPTSVVERIEVLKDGASAIYGSDAIAGVINIITTDSFEGMEASAYFSETSEGDGRTETYDFTTGTSSDRTSIVLNASFQKNEAVSAGDREISAVPQFGADFCASSTSPVGRFGLAGRTGTFTLTNPTATLPGQVQSATNIRPFSIPQDCYNFAPDNYLTTPQERYALYAKLRHDLSSNIAFKVETLYSNRTSEQLLAPIPVVFAGSGLFGTNNQFDVSPDSFFNPFGVSTTRVQRRLNETGGRSFSQDVDVWHFNGLFEGYFDWAERSFNWDAGYTFSLNQENDITRGQVNLNRIQAAVGPSFRDAQGQLRCGTASNVVIGCVPLNLFGGNGSITQEMLDYISVPLQDAFEYRRLGYQANISAPLFELPAGSLAFAAGYEYRRESGFDLPDALTATGASSGNIRGATSGGFSVDEAYIELAAPLLAGVTGAQLLELSIATRYSDYNTFGDTTNSKFGIKWKPINDLVVRASVSESFRAPDIASLFLGQADAFPSVNDPCTGAGQATTNRFAILTAEQRARCIAAGVPATGAQQASGQIRTTVGGNPNLTPESADSNSFGLVYSPDYIPGFDIGVDWWRIELTNTITAYGAQTILDACILGGASAQCALISRLTGTGAVTGVVTNNINAGGTDVEGIDLFASYQWQTDNWGSFKVVLDSTYNIESLTVIDSGIPNDPIVSSSVGNYGGRGADPARLKTNAALTWGYGDWTVAWSSRYRSRSEEDCSGAVDVETQCSNPAGAPFNVDGLLGNGLEITPLNKLGGTTYHDLQVRWKAPWNGSFLSGVRNLGDKDPPVSISTFANSFDPVYDIPGRVYYLSYKHTF